MTLIKCPECGKKVSIESAHCRNCGCPVPKIEKKQIETDTITETTFVKKQTSEESQNIKTIRCKCGAEIAEGARFCPECGYSLYAGNTNLNTEQDSVEEHIVMTPTSNGAAKRKSKAKPWIIAVAGVLVALIIAILLFPKNGIENEVKAILEDDLGSSIKITALYYNEDKEGCLVEFETKTSIDVAAVHLDTGKIDYKSEYAYYSEKAEKLRKQSPINESELHYCNQKILESSYPDWNFTIAVMKANGETEKNGWKKIK